MKIKSNLREQIQELEEKIEEVKDKLQMAEGFNLIFENLEFPAKEYKKELINLINIQRNIKEKLERLEEYYEK